MIFSFLDHRAMKQEEFVDRVRTHVRDAAVEGVLSLLQRPPGRRPAAELADLGAWYAQLAPEDRDRVRRLLVLAGDQLVFGMFAVLDGSRIIETHEGPKGHFDLRHVDPSGAETVLVGDGASMLHELL